MEALPAQNNPVCEFKDLGSVLKNFALIFSTMSCDERLNASNLQSHTEDRE
jgi:hypothetical protein